VSGRLLGMSLREILARNLRRLRAERGLSQEELAHRAGVNRNYVGMIEREENAATVDMMEQLAAALDVDATDLIDPYAASDK
jgi:transcriptional regulator with XRE-family HTH domain